MNDPILKSFLRQNIAQATALAAASDFLVFTPEPGDFPQRFLAEFRCKGLVKRADGKIVEANRFLVGISISDEHVRGPVDPIRLLTWLGPQNVFHPNISTMAPVICVGRIGPSIDLVWILYQVFELISWQKWSANDFLNAEAAQWARNNAASLPIDRRPLKRRRLELQLEPLAGGQS